MDLLIEGVIELPNQRSCRHLMERRATIKEATPTIQLAEYDGDLAI
jgi:hypothetical protein